MDANNSIILSELIAERQLSAENIGRVMRLYSLDRDVIPYLQKEYTDAQLQEILIGLEEGCDVSFYDNTKLSPEQMRAIRLGLSQYPCGHSALSAVAPEPVYEQSIGETQEVDTSSDEKQDSSTDEVVMQTEAQQMNKDAEAEDSESDSPDGKMIGKIIAFIFVGALILVPRLIAEKNKRAAMEFYHDLDERGWVVKDGNLKIETSLTTVNSGDISLSHNKGWTSETGDTDGYGYYINLNHSSSYVAFIQVAAIVNPKRLSLNDAISIAENRVSSIFESVKTTIEEVQDFDLNGIPAKAFNYSVSMVGERKMHRRCIVAVKDKYVVIVNEEFKDYHDKDFDYIFGSIERSINIKSRH